MSALYRIRSLTVTNDKATFDPSDIFYALNDLQHLATLARNHIVEMNYPEQVADDLNMLAGVIRIIADDLALLREATAVFDGPRKWVQVEGQS